MSESVRLDWRVPSDEWGQFREYVTDEYGRIRGYLGKEAELAMMQYADSDGYSGVENRVDELVRAAGRTPEAFTENGTDTLTEQETTRVTCRVDADVKDEFRDEARKSDHNYGVVFAKAIRSHRQGGRPGRLERKLDRILDDAKSLLSSLSEAAEESLTEREEKTLILSHRLPERFSDKALREEIKDVAGDTDKTIRRYREKLRKKQILEPHPGIERKPNSDPERLWIPAHEAAELRPDGEPEECRRPVDILDRDERIRRLKLIVGRRAANRKHGKATITTTTVVSEVFDGEVSANKTRELMKEAGFARGFHLDESGQSTKIRANLNELEEYNQDLLAEIIEYRDAEAESVFESEPSESTDDWDEEETDPVKEADAALDALQQAQAATDGGEPAPGDD